ncbi:protoporphyrinogen oxidase [Gordonia polyisoprenivorans]|uniref:protoporphyrinogen oxidase n=1 Tax=Gordonia polyisoprenivorans TaxID=84595 RepID=UPI002301ECB6|nr:protoporphyrinogen oxidase [Gordonia polyisoprenivorans]WCB39821.1 protoporphyrinogen oxidase [Gordonia polyisoprenivorans]
MPARVAIVGGGVSGLVAAYRLRRALGDDATIDLYEQRERLGGVLHTVDVAGQATDVGAEAFIVRRPEAVALVDELGLADRVVSPTPRRPAIWAGGRLHPMPAPALMGIPATAEVMAGLADPADLARIAAEPDRALAWRPGDDVAVGDLVADRFGASVVARSVDPMLGGVYSSLAADIGVREAIPALTARLDAGAPNLSAAVGGLLNPVGTGGPVFGTLVGGYRVLVDALTAAARPALCTDRQVVAVHADGDRWRVGTESGTDADYDGLVLAVPAWTAARLLAGIGDEFVATLAAVEPASSVVVSIALAPGTALPDHSGVLVATGEDLRPKAFTLSSQKWAHVGGDGAAVSVRASFGRYGDPVADPADDPRIDESLQSWALTDLDRICVAAGVSAPSEHVLEVRVQRWDGGLPRYAPGHLDRMAGVLDALPPRLALAGSSYAGVGVPACIATAGRAAEVILAALG